MRIHGSQARRQFGSKKSPGLAEARFATFPGPEAHSWPRPDRPTVVTAMQASPFRATELTAVRNSQSLRCSTSEAYEPSVPTPNDSLCNRLYETVYTVEQVHRMVTIDQTVVAMASRAGRTYSTPSFVKEWSCPCLSRDSLDKNWMRPLQPMERRKQARNAVN